MTETDYAVEMSGLTRRFGEFLAVDNITLTIPKGRLYGFLGLNGAGKTTTIRILTTLLPPSAGSAKLWGHDVAREPLAVRHLVGLVSDETSESQSAWTHSGRGIRRGGLQIAGGDVIDRQELAKRRVRPCLDRIVVSSSSASSHHVHLKNG